MTSEEFYSLLIEDLKTSGLTPEQIKQAVGYNVSSEKEKNVIGSLVDKRFASWIPSGMIANPGTGFDFEADPSYTARLKRVNSPEEIKEDVSEIDKKREELIRTLEETASICDRDGFIKQANFLDHLIETLA